MQLQQEHQLRPPILRTKLCIPQVRSDLVRRQHLFEKLNAALSRKLTLVSAPAGFGKTTLVSAWISNHSDNGDSPAAWVALDVGDNDPVRFWHYLITACQRFDAAIGETALALLGSTQQPAWEHLLTAFINDLARLSGNHLLVLEDYHLITTPQIHELMAFLLDYLPTTLHLVITTRSEPPLPLARLRAQFELTELRAADLRFSLEETQAFFGVTARQPLDYELIERLDARTEGWVTALRLVALTLQGQPEAEPEAVECLLDRCTGSHKHIFAYLVAEVLNKQPPSLQAFLLQTSILDHLTGPLCDAVTGNDRSEMLLEQLEHANIFLHPLDTRGQWYRYHALFAEALQHEARRRWGEAHLRELLLVASQWYQQQGLLSEAIEAALAARDMPRAAELIERLVTPDPAQNKHHTLRRWLEQLPEELLHAHPSLCMVYAMAILFTSDRRAPTTFALLQTAVQTAEQHWRAEQNEQQLGEVLDFRAFVAWWQGDQREAFELAKQAIALLPEGKTRWRGFSLDLVGMEALQAGQLHTSRRIFTDARACWKAAGNRYGSLAATLVLGEVCVRQAELHQAASFYQQILDEAECAPIQQQQLRNRIGAARLGLAGLTLERNDLTTAEQHTANAMLMSQHPTNDDLRLRGSLMGARITHALGKTAEAQEMLHTILAQTPHRQLLPILRDAHLYRARFALASGDLATAERCVATLHQGDDLTRLHAEQVALARARIQIARGETEAALELLARWHDDAHDQGRRQSQLEITLLESLAHFTNQGFSRAKASLLLVLADACAEGYQRLFVNEGKTMATLLRAVWPEVKDEPLAVYVRTLLLAFAQEQPAGAAPDTLLLAEPLSPQERRVLHMLMVGLSNGEIAKRLVVSINTVKTQVQSIYRKLNVNSRQEASNAARHLLVKHF